LVYTYFSSFEKQRFLREETGGGGGRGLTLDEVLCVRSHGASTHTEREREVGECLERYWWRRVCCGGWLVVRRGEELSLLFKSARKSPLTIGLLQYFFDNFEQELLHGPRSNSHSAHAHALSRPPTACIPAAHHSAITTYATAATRLSECRHRETHATPATAGLNSLFLSPPRGVFLFVSCIFPYIVRVCSAATLFAGVGGLDSASRENSRAATPR
jgi:hypothetical protein